MSGHEGTNDDERAPVRVATREQFDEAVGELFRTGQPIEAPSMELLAAWDVDLEDEDGGIEGAVMGKLKEKADEYHEQFAARITKALEAGTAPWQKPCPPY